MSSQAMLSIDSPLGPVRLYARSGRLVAIYFDNHRHEPARQASSAAASHEPLLRAAAEELEAYFAGRRESFDLPLAPAGTPFQLAVWTALQAIPFGATTTYGELARCLGTTNAARAVGAAVGRNPLSIVIPCHRVVGSAGQLTGYAGGLERKRWLLEHERPSLWTCVS